MIGCQFFVHIPIEFTWKSASDFTPTEDDEGFVVVHFYVWFCSIFGVNSIEEPQLIKWVKGFEDGYSIISLVRSITI